jgi:hypothetical protein
MVRRRSTVRFSKGAPGSEGFPIIEPSTSPAASGTLSGMIHRRSDNLISLLFLFGNTWESREGAYLAESAGAVPAHRTGTRSLVSEIQQGPGEDQTGCRLRQAGQGRSGAHGFHAAEALIAMAELTCGLCLDLPRR